MQIAYLDAQAVRRLLDLSPQIVRKLLDVGPQIVIHSTDFTSKARNLATKLFNSFVKIHFCNKRLTYRLRQRLGLHFSLLFREPGRTKSFRIT